MSQNPEHDANEARFLERMMQNSFFHSQEGGFTPVQMYQLNEMGLVDECKLEEPRFPTNLLDVLSDSEHPDRKSVPEGPLLFVKEEDGVSVVEVAPLLLHSDGEIRVAARDFILRDPHDRLQLWTARSIEAVSILSEDVESDSFAVWRTAGLNLVPKLQMDFAAQLAGARQCMFARYQIGLDNFLPQLILPTLQSLEKITPPIWNPSEQQALIGEKIESFAAADTLQEALDSYVDFCGYLPLAKEQCVAAVALRWTESHPNQSVSFESIASWVEKSASPFAEYHAAILVLHVASFRPKGEWELVWKWLQNVLDVSSSTGAECENVGWRLYCELANHYCKGIESLFPGQRGESIACGAWWLSFQWSCAFGKHPSVVGRLLEHVVVPESERAFLRWLISRSPVAPSSFRQCTLNVASVWAMSLLTQIAATKDALDLESAPEDVGELVYSTLAGYVMSSPLSQPHRSPPIFAYEETVDFADLFGLIKDAKLQEATIGLSEFRRSTASGNDLNLFGVAEKSDGEIPLLYFLAFKDRVFCSDINDHSISQWLQDGVKVSDDLKGIELQSLSLLLDSLAEFYQRNQRDWGIRLPHVLAYSIEGCDDFSRVETMFFGMLFMCVNGGITSPIERVMTGKWRNQLVEPLNLWRVNSRIVLPDIASWASGRIRATNAVITRLIGPAFDPTHLDKTPKQRKRGKKTALPSKKGKKKRRRKPPKRKRK